jgi:dolichol-phosphate mannosyltransferase
LAALQGRSCQVLVVDDGSQDGTAAVVQSAAQSAPVTLVSHPRNLGLGAAIQTGLRAACERAVGGDVIVTMDADNTHPPQLILEMEKAVQHGSEVVIASRYAPGGEEIGLKLHRKLLSLGSSWLMSVFVPVQGVRDYTCGYRAYRAGLLKEAFDFYDGALVEETGFTCMAEILLKLSAMRPVAINEVPLVLRYDLKLTPSKMKIWRTIRRYISLIRRQVAQRRRIQR